MATADSDLNQALILDIGSGMAKVGFGGDDAPRACFPACTGKLRVFGTGSIGFAGMKDVYVGDEAQAKRGILEPLLFPVEHGEVVTHWEEYERILSHTFETELRVEPEEHCVLLSESPLIAPETHDRIHKLMFETFGALAVYSKCADVLSLYASGRRTGLVVGSGDGVTHTVPIVEDEYSRDAVEKMLYAGRDITERLFELLVERGYDMTTHAEKEIVRDIKEKLCYISQDIDEEKLKDDAMSHVDHAYELPDGSSMTISCERFKAPELLFRPSLIEMEALGIHEATLQSILKSDAKIHDELYQNIVLAGGSTMFSGIVERLTNEVVRGAPETTKVEVNAPDERKFSVWIGGSILASLAVFQNSWITKAEYDDVGQPSTVGHRWRF